MSVHHLIILPLDTASTHGKFHYSYSYYEITCTFNSPGRFFAANEIKGMFIHIIMNYDIMFESDTGRPQNTHNFIQASPYEDIQMLFRKHQT